jgi:hypothetical protein
VNRVVGRRGRVWSDRYHARHLRTPREVRHGVVYILANWLKHVGGARGFDPCTSAAWFDGWRARRPPDPRHSNPGHPPPVVASRTWLGSTGWRRYGLIDVRERPAARRRPLRSASGAQS